MSWIFHFEAFTLFCRKFAIVTIYTLFWVKFWPQKLWSCKKIDKYHVCHISAEEGRGLTMATWFCNFTWVCIRPEKSKNRAWNHCRAHVRHVKSLLNKNGDAPIFPVSEKLSLFLVWFCSVSSKYDGALILLPELGAGGVLRKTEQESVLQSRNNGDPLKTCF